MEGFFAGGSLSATGGMYLCRDTRRAAEDLFRQAVCSDQDGTAVAESLCVTAVHSVRHSNCAESFVYPVEQSVDREFC